MRLYKILPLLFFLSVGPALAEDTLAPLHFFGHYDFDWNGIYIGSLTLGIEETPKTYSMQLKVVSGGVVNLFTRHSDDTVANGKIKGSSYIPIHYESYYKTKNKPRHIELTYNQKSVVTKEIVEPPEDPTDRPIVPHALKDGSYDPLTLLMAIRSGVKDSRSFDVRHVYDIKSESSAPKRIRLPQGVREVIPYTLTRTPLAGLTAKEKKEYGNGEPHLYLYLSNDEGRIPLMMSVPFLGSVKGVLVKECTTWEACAL